VLRPIGRLARTLLRSRILKVFLVLCVLGFWVGAQTRPAPGTFPYAELFDQLSVVSYRDTPSDTTTRFIVQLAAAGKVFSEYDIDARTFLPPSHGRGYGRTITGTHYGPLRVRGHVGYGCWLDVPESSRRALLPVQFDELYRTTLGFMKPVSQITGVLGILTGYSVGYRLGTWSGSLRSHAVQERVLATPNLGRIITREAWRRVLLEPVVMTGEDDATRFAAVTGTHRVYTNFLRVALDDSNGFVPREADRLAGLGRIQESRAMVAFTEAVRRAAIDSTHLASADFEAIERWAALLDRNGHWARGAIPPPGEERIKLLGTLAWYGLAPPAGPVDRVWVGPRMLVRTGGIEGFVADEIPETGVGCPISWRAHLREEWTGAGATANAWLADRPEFAALIVFGRRVASGLEHAREHVATWRRAAPGEPTAPARDSRRTVTATFANRVPAVESAPADSAWRHNVQFPIRSSSGDGSITLATTDSAGGAVIARAAQAAGARVDTAAGMPTSPGEGAGIPVGGAAEGDAVDAMARSLRNHGVSDALLELSGNAVALGSSVAGDPWSIQLADPRGRIPGIARVRLAPGQAISCSGRYDPLVVANGGSHEPAVDPRTARPGAGLIGVAVLGPDARSAEAWKAALLVLDPREAIAKARDRSDLPAILIEPGVNGPDVIWVDADLKGRFVLGREAQTLFDVRYF
jgi:ApbE family protein